MPEVHPRTRVDRSPSSRSGQHSPLEPEPAVLQSERSTPLPPRAAYLLGLVPPQRRVLDTARRELHVAQSPQRMSSPLRQSPGLRRVPEMADSDPWPLGTLHGPLAAAATALQQNIERAPPRTRPDLPMTDQPEIRAGAAQLRSRIAANLDTSPRASRRGVRSPLMPPAPRMF